MKRQAVLFRIPMHSGLAAFVYIKMKLLEVGILGTVEDQARWWAQQYHQGGGVVQDFVDIATKTDEHCMFISFM